MDKQFTISDTDKIFATGIFLQPVECVLNEKKQWRWVAVGFEDDSYYNGDRIDIYNYANTLDGLIADSEE